MTTKAVCHYIFVVRMTMCAIFTIRKVGLNIFYSEEKDWARHTTRQCPLQEGRFYKEGSDEQREIFLKQSVNIHETVCKQIQTN